MLKVLHLALVGVLTFSLPLGAQNATGSISGVVQDTQGAVIPGATVVLLNQDQGVEVRQMLTNESGIFLFTPLSAATYTVTVELPGFKKYTTKDVKLFVNAKLGLPAIMLEVGSQAESITVEAQAVQLETVSAERSGVITGRQMIDIALNGRNFTGLLKTVPGAPADSGGGTASFNGQRNSQNNFIVDGQTVIDIGVNQQFAYRINTDAIAEFKVSTNSQGAEFGRNSGAQIQVVTKSGSQQFHGGGYFFKRHEGWNANSFTNNRQGTPRQIYRFMNTGYNVGGPIYIPGKFNADKSKFFFFLSHEWGRQRTPNTPRRVTVPTAAERQGDFSATRDGAGIPVFIRDPLRTGNCNATDQTACFPGNRIPSDRFSPYGPQVLNWLPMPNTFGNPTYNYESQVAGEDPSFDQVYRFDYNINDRWRAFVRVIRSRDTANNPYGRADSGNNLGLSPFLAQNYGRGITGNVTTIISPTLTNEFQVGYTVNGIPGDAAPDGSPYYRSVSKITIPLLYPDADPAGLIPNFGFGGVAGSDAMTSFAGVPYANRNPITNVTENITKIHSTHTFKAGLFIEYAVKTESPFRPINSTIQFGRDAQNPGDTNWAFSNALLGNFQTYTQFNKFVVPNYPYWNVEWYGQDTWKATRKLTLSYGLRVNIVKPLYEKDNLITNFDPERYDPAQRVILYQPTLVGTARRARNPLTGETAPAALIGAIVPGVGSINNGIVRAGENGVPRSLIDHRGPQWGPRIGLAYAFDNKTVLRIGGGAFYERISTFSINWTTAYLTNPPTLQQSQIYYGNLSTIASSPGINFPVNLRYISKDGHVPTTYNFSAGIQRELPLDVLLDVSYVGTQSRHLTENYPFNNVPFGSAWLPENQDPTVTPRFDGTTTLPAQLYRRYPGYTAENIVTFGGSSNYNALQVSANRRLGRLQFGTSYTWSKAMGTSGGHLIDARKANYGLLGLDRSHGLTFNYIYDLPVAAPGSLLDKPVLKQVLNGWQISGVTSMSVGSPQTIGYTLTGISNADRNRRITGSEDIAPRVVLTCNPNLPRSKRTLTAFIDTSCFAPAPQGSLGMDSGVNTVRGPGLHQWDISVFKKFNFGSEDSRRYIQLRMEAYNAFNHTQWGGFASSIQFNPTTGQIVNLPSPTNRDGFGALTTVRGNSQRIIQLAAKLYF